MAETPPPPAGHKAGFVSIVGKPNAGKSTLMNRMVGERIAIVTAKAQTTRHRIKGVISGEGYQIVYSDTPGLIAEPQYELHKSMNRFIELSFEDADAILYVADVQEAADLSRLPAKLAKVNLPVILALNKVDLSQPDAVKERMDEWKVALREFGWAHAQVAPVSALEDFNVDTVFDLLLEAMPEHPAFYPDDELTDKTERFLAAEIVREQIFEHCQKEVPYSSEVAIVSFKELSDIIRISAEIYVERDSQKGIVIGKGGTMLKRIGEGARKQMEAFFGKKVFLEQHVKVVADWRKDPRQLKRFGYRQ